MIEVFLDDRKMRGIVPDSKQINLIDSFEPKAKTKAMIARNLFILTTISNLSEVIEIAKESDRFGHLRMLIIRSDIGDLVSNELADAVFSAIDPRKIVVYGDRHLSEIPPIAITRILSAWAIGAPKDLIAHAKVSSDDPWRLSIFACNGDNLCIHFCSRPALYKIPPHERKNFVISEEGSYIHWPQTDTHLDLDAFRSMVDPADKEMFDELRREHDSNYGRAIASLRREHNLAYADLPVNEETMRAIESGRERSTLPTLTLLAKAHGMPLSDYLDAIADRLP